LATPVFPSTLNNPPSTFSFSATQSSMIPFTHRSLTSDELAIGCRLSAVSQMIGHAGLARYTPRGIPYAEGGERLSDPPERVKMRKTPGGSLRIFELRSANARAAFQKTDDQNLGGVLHTCYLGRRTGEALGAVNKQYRLTHQE
jgi:hypothetical protein